MNTTTAWLELNTPNPKDAIDFYSQTLGWDFEASDLPDGGKYWIARHNKRPVGGVFDLAMEDAEDIPAHWMTYMKVKDISKAQRAARDAGGSVPRPALELEGIGKLAIITDSEGAMVGLIEATPALPKNKISTSSGKRAKSTQRAKAN